MRVRWSGGGHPPRVAAAREAVDSFPLIIKPYPTEALAKAVRKALG